MGSIVGPTIAIVLWLSISWSHWEEKRLFLLGIVQHVTISDITDTDATLISTTDNPNQHPQQPTPFAKSSLKLPFARVSSDATGHVELSELSQLQSAALSVPDTASSLGRAASESTLGRTASEQQGIHLLGITHAPEPSQAAEQVISALKSVLFSMFYCPAAFAQAGLRRFECVCVPV